MASSSGRDFVGRQDRRGARAMPDACGGFGSAFFWRELRGYSGYPVAPSHRGNHLARDATEAEPASLLAIRLDLDELARLLAGYGRSYELLGGDQERPPLRAVRNHRLRPIPPPAALL